MLDLAATFAVPLLSVLVVAVLRRPYPVVPVACLFAGVASLEIGGIETSKSLMSMVVLVSFAIGVLGGLLLTRLREGVWFPPRSGFWGKMIRKVPAGWYPDPAVPGSLRYWDGSQWTGHTHPASGRPGDPGVGDAGTGQPP